MLLHDLWGTGAANTRHFIVAIGPGDSKAIKQFAVQTVEQGEQTAAAIAAEGWNAYFAVGSFVEARTQADCVELPALWLDLDVGTGEQKYPTTEAAATALWGWLAQHHLPEPTHVVASGGGGLHVYWRLTESVPHAAWLPVARHLKQALRVAGVKADPTRTADSASILRVPGTVHTKDPSNPREVRLLRRDDRRVDLAAFAAALPGVGPQRVVDTPAIAAEWDVRPALHPGNADAIAAACLQMSGFRAAKGAVPEPYWRAALSVLKRCSNGDQLIHDWSKGDPRYDRYETQRKADSTGGPATCAHFDEVNPGGCAGCPLAGRITSPIQAAIDPQPIDAVPERPYRVGKFKAFTITNDAVWYQPPAPEGQTSELSKVSEFPLWVVQVRNRAAMSDQQSNGAASMLEWVTVDGRTQQGVLRHSLLADQAGFRTWMADAGLAIGVRDWKLMTYYLSELSLSHMREHGVTYFYEALGWYNDNSTFVVGDQRVTAKGVEPAQVQVAHTVAQLRAPTRGSLAGWVENIKPLGQALYARNAYALLHSFGSPLLHLCDMGAAVLSMAGTSGAGKTVTMDAALSIWGDPKLLAYNGGSSVRAIGQGLAAHRHIPYGLDETTILEPRALRDIVYLMANGKADAKLRRDGGMRDTGSWALSAIVTTNIPILASNQRHFNEAARRRVVEVTFDTAMDTETGSRVRAAHRFHHGHAWVPYMQQVLQQQANIPKLVEEAMGALARRYKWPPAQRFALWSLSTALIGGLLAQQVGLLPGFDVPFIIDVVAGHVQTNVDETLDNSELARNVISEWLNENARNIVFWRTGLVHAGDTPADPVARVLGNGRIAVHRSKLNEALREAGISSRDGLRSLGTDARPEPDRRIRLLPDLPSVWCYFLDGKTLGVELDDLPPPAA